jgi:hypothetical protein
MMVAMYDIVGKNACKVITLFSPTKGPHARSGDALKQRYLRKIVQYTLHALARDSVCVEKVFVLEVKGGIPSPKRQFTIDIFAE